MFGGIRGGAGLAFTSGSGSMGMGISPGKPRVSGVPSFATAPTPTVGVTSGMGAIPTHTALVILVLIEAVFLGWGRYLSRSRHGG